MLAMLLDAPCRPLRAADVPRPVPGPGDVLVRVRACGVCRTDLHIVDGELVAPAYPVIPGHEIVGVAEEVGEAVERIAPGDRVGVPWLGWTCGACDHCRSGRENLCDRARFTGFHVGGGDPEYAVADPRYSLPIPDG